MARLRTYLTVFDNGKQVMNNSLANAHTLTNRPKQLRVFLPLNGDGVCAPGRLEPSWVFLWPYSARQKAPKPGGAEDNGCRYVARLGCNSRIIRLARRRPKPRDRRDATWAFRLTELERSSFLCFWVGEAFDWIYRTTAVRGNQ